MLFPNNSSTSSSGQQQAEAAHPPPKDGTATGESPISTSAQPGGDRTGAAALASATYTHFYDFPDYLQLCGQEAPEASDAISCYMESFPYAERKLQGLNIANLPHYFAAIFGLKQRPDLNGVLAWVDISQTRSYEGAWAQARVPCVPLPSDFLQLALDWRRDGLRKVAPRFVSSCKDQRDAKAVGVRMCNLRYFDLERFVDDHAPTNLDSRSRNNSTFPTNGNNLHHSSDSDDSDPDFDLCDYFGALGKNF